MSSSKFVFNLTGNLSLGGLFGPGSPPMLPGGDPLTSVFFKAKVSFDGKPVVNRRKPLIAKDFKIKSLGAKATVQANGSSGLLLLGLENVKVPFSSPIKLNKQLIANPLAAATFADTSNITGSASGLAGGLFGGLFGGGMAPMPILPLV